MAVSVASRTPSSAPAKNSRGTAMRSPSTPRSQPAEKSGTGTLAEVESQGSGPAIAWSSVAPSCTLRANGPIWSRELAKAISP